MWRRSTVKCGCWKDTAQVAVLQKRLSLLYCFGTFEASSCFKVYLGRNVSFESRVHDSRFGTTVSLETSLSNADRCE